MKVSDITVSLSCFNRPERTRRAIQCILDQDINNWEAFIMGDNCPHFEKLINSGYLEQIRCEQAKKGNIIHYFNAEKRGGGWGYKLTNHAIQHSNGKYIIFFDNDDIILPDHFRHYLSEIENTEYGLVYYNSFLAPIRENRNTIFNCGQIGHCDIIVREDVAKKAAPHDSSYSQDWKFIDSCRYFGKIKKAASKKNTYHVMRLASASSIETID